MMSSYLATGGHRAGTSTLLLWALCVLLSAGTLCAGADGIFGNTLAPVWTYLKVGRGSRDLLCLSKDLSESQLADTAYFWIGPDGRRIEGDSQIDVKDGILHLSPRFQASRSGPFSCTLKYRNMATGKDMFVLYRFLVYGYVDPLYSYSFLAQFRVAQCDSAINQQYLQNLLPAVKNLLLRVACRVTDPSMECHLMNEPGSDLQNKLFVSFTVDSFGKDWEAFCRKLPADCREDANQRVEQARQMLHNFFETEASVMKRQPGMYIQETRLSENRIASCPPGYGINSERHPECSVCCVACDPGTYSGKDSVTCEHCDSAEVWDYAATACP